jgi:beta-lactamase regulating signal transducer with metallopeptidase domain
MTTELLLTIGSSPVLSLVAKSTLVLGTGLAAVALARRATAATRHMVLAAVFASLLLLPIVASVAPPIGVPIRAEIAGPAAVSPAEPAAGTQAPRKVPLEAVLSQDWSIPWFVHALQNWRSIDFASGPGALASMVWMAGALVAGVPIVMGVWQSRRLRARAIPCPAIETMASRLAAEAGIRRTVHVGCDEQVASPFTSGFLRPVLVLSADAGAWPEDDLRRALVHELEHVRRGDWLVQLGIRTVLAAYWFHPLAWVAWRRLRLEAERACDDAVLRVAEGTDYAAQLVGLARRYLERGSYALGMARRSDLAARVTAVLDGNRRRGRASVPGAVTVWIAAALVSVLVGAVRTAASPQANEARSSSRQQGPSRQDRALYYASDRGDVEAVDRLVSQGADVNAVFASDGSPLIAAARAGHVSTVAALLDRGADPNLAVPGDGNPLIMAAREGHLAVVTLLLDRGAAVDLAVPADENALIQASGRGHLAVVQALVARGADVNTRIWADGSLRSPDDEWRSPLRMARRGGHAAVVAFLEARGARD